MAEEKIEYWVLLAGIGIFLFGIYLLEESIKLLSGKAFKTFLRKYTETPLKGVVTGTVATAVLQSSSAVTLMILAFAGAGIMELSSAIGVILGSNLGTTLTSWIVATIGFKIKIESISLPIIGIGGLGLIFLGKSPKWSNFSKLLVGFGFLFMGLDYMKNSIDGMASSIDFSQYADYPAIAFLVLGFILTALVQSSSAAMAIILSVLFSGLIGFDKAAAMVIGTNMGTTVTVLLGSISGPRVKKQIGLSHFIFNFTTGFVAILTLPVFSYLILDIFKLKSEPVIALALFHTLFNLFGVLLFLPFLRSFGMLLNKAIPEKQDAIIPLLPDLTTEVPEAGIKSLNDAILQLITQTLHFNLKLIKIERNLVLPSYPNFELIEALSAQDHYKYLKNFQATLFSFAAQIQKKELSEEEASALRKSLHATRFAVSSAKTMKDIKNDLEECMTSDSNFILMTYQNFRKFSLSFYQVIVTLLYEQEDNETLAKLHAQRNNTIQLDVFFIKSLTTELADRPLSTDETNYLLSANRGFILSARQLISSVRDYLLTDEEIQIFEGLN
jgi:phosphate:Na+ symporter